jgi:DNA-binding XRE family transcriptional regulator
MAQSNGETMYILEGRQLTAARALAELTVAELADAADVTSRTIHRIEIGEIVYIAPKRRHGHVSQEVFGKIKDALAHRGVELVPESDAHGAGARWRLPRSQRGTD